MLGTLRRCWLPLVSAGVVLGLWHMPILKPIQIFMVQVHEMFHVGAAVATGGKVTKMAIRHDGKGRTVSKDECIPLVASVGYMGSAFLGAFLIYAGTRPLLQRMALGMLGASSILVSHVYAEADSLAFYYGAIGGAFLLAVAVGFSRDAAKIAGTGLGVMLCLFVLYDFKVDLWVHPEKTDVGVLMRSLDRPDLVFPMVYAWTALTFGAIFWALWQVDRAGRRLDAERAPAGIAHRSFLGFGTHLDVDGDFRRLAGLQADTAGQNHL